MTMGRVGATWLIALAALASATAAGAQPLAARIAAVRDGTVRLTYAARSGVCGDGRDVVRDGANTYTLESMSTFRNAELSRCEFGPVRAEIERVDGGTRRIRLHVGGRWDAASGVTDLGVVAAPDAARWFIAEARRQSGRNAARALYAAVFADSAAIAPELDALARDETAERSVRGGAVFALAALDDADAHRRLRALVTDDRLDTDRRGEAIIALAHGGIERDDARFLREIYPKLDPRLRDKVFLAVSHSDDRETLGWLVGRVTDRSEPMEIRRQALFWSGQGNVSTAELDALYPELDARELREHYTFVLSQRRDSAAVAQLIAIADHDSDRGVRRQAMFWLGQSHDPRAAAWLREVLTR